MDTNEIIAKYKKYLTQKQIDDLIAKTEQFRMANAGNRANARTQLAKQYRQARRGLQNMGLAGREGKLISGREVGVNDALRDSYDEYNRQLKGVENARLEQLAAAHAEATRRARAAAAEEAARKAAEAAAMERERANQEQFTDPRLNLPKPTLNQYKQPVRAAQPSSDVDPRFASPIAAPDKAIVASARHYIDEMMRSPISRFAKEYNVDQTAIDGLQKTSPDIAGTIASTYRTIDEKRDAWAAAIKKGDGIIKPKTRNEFERMQDAHKARREMAEAYSTLGRIVLASEVKDPVQNNKGGVLHTSKAAVSDDGKYLLTTSARNLYLMSDADFSTAFDAAESLYKKGKLSDEVFSRYESVQMGRKLSSERAMKYGLVEPDYGYTYKYQPGDREEGDDWNDVRTYDKTRGTQDSNYAAIVNDISRGLEYNERAYLYTARANMGFAHMRGEKQSYIQSVVWYKDGVVKGETTNAAKYDKAEAVVIAASYMTNEEIARFNTILGKYGAKEADDYFELLYETVLPARVNQAIDEDNDAMLRRETKYDENGNRIGSTQGEDTWAAQLTTTLLSVPLNIVEGIFNPWVTMKTKLQDSNAAQFNARALGSAQEIRNAVSENFSDAKWGGKFWYGVGTSAADSAAVAAISGGLGNVFSGALKSIGLAAETAAKVGGKVGSFLGGMILGGSAYNSSYSDALQRGLTPDKARATAFGNGVNEMLFESLSLDLLVSRFKTGDIVKVSEKAWKNWIVNTLIEAGVEGSEEVFTDLANNIWDKCINGIYSEEVTKMRQYIASGMSYEDAKRKVNEEFAWQLWESFKAGSISGGVMGGGASFMGMVQNRQNEKLGKGLRQDSKIMNAINDHQFENEYAQEILKQKKLTNQDVFELYAIMQQELAAKYKADVDQAVKDGKITQEEADLVRKWEENGKQIEKDGKVIGNENGVTAEEFAKVLEILPQMPNANKLKLLSNDQQARLVQAVGGETASVIDQSVTADREAEKKYQQTVREINNDTTLSPELKQKRLEAAERTRQNARSEASKIADTAFTNKKGIGAKLETDGNGTVKVGKGSGKVTYDFSTKDNPGHQTVDSMTATEQSALRLAKIVAASRPDVNVKVEAEFVGEHANENGYYDRNTNTIHINMSGDNSVLWTLSHELTHHLANTDTEAYAALRTAIETALKDSSLTTTQLEERGFEYDLDKVDPYIAREGNLWDALVAFEREEHGYGKDAEEEVVARCCESFLGFNQFVKDFARKQYKSAKAINKFIAQMNIDMQRVSEDARQSAAQRNVWNDESPENQILRQLTEIDRIANLWRIAVNAEAKKRLDAKEAQQAEIRHAKKDVVDLSDDTELNRAVEGLHGSEKYKAISKYILNTLYDQPITLSDGTKAVVDKSDANHIASNAASKKTAQIAKIRDLVEKAILYAIDDNAEHNKFDSFKYYLASVRYKGETTPIYLNVGHGKYDNEYHLYDITQKIRDTAHRINGVERARSSRSENGTSINIIPSTKDSVKRSDTEYLDLARRYESGDKSVEAELRKAVDAAAKKAGYAITAFHGTSAKFTVFDQEHPRKAYPIGKSFGDGYYFAAGKAHAENYVEGKDGTLLDTYLKIGKPYVVVTGTELSRADFDEMKDRLGYGEDIDKKNVQIVLQKYGYDGIIAKNYKGNPYTYVVYSPSQIKSADLITKDDNGNIIPLSGRFNTENEDIRYSAKDNVALTDKEYETKRDQYRKESSSIKDELQDVRAKLQEIEQSDSYKAAFERMYDKSLSDEEWKAAIDAFAKVEVESGHDALYKRQKELIEQQTAISKEWDNIVRDKELSDYRNAVKESGLTEAEYSRKEAVKEFGYTPHYYDAGYILPNGKMLNFSGEKGKHYGTRGQDHRAIGNIYPDSQGSEAMLRFMRDGNIRIMAETPGVDIDAKTEPTASQYSQIRNFASSYAKEEYFSVDFTDENGYSAGSLEYDGHVNPSRVVNDIKYFYQTGTIRQQSSVSQFHYSKMDKVRLSTADGTRTYTLGDVTAKLYGNDVELDGGKVRQRVQMMEAIAEVNGTARVDAASEEEAEAFRRAGAEQVVEELEGHGAKYGTWEFTNEERKFTNDSRYDIKQKQKFAKSILKQVGKSSGFTQAQRVKYGAALGRLMDYLWEMQYGKMDGKVVFEFADRLFDSILNDYTALSEADEEFRSELLANMTKTKNAKGSTVYVLEVNDTQMREIKYAYNNNAQAYASRLSKALGVRVTVKQTENAKTLEDIFTNSTDTRIKSDTNEGDMPSELLRIAQETESRKTNPYAAESDERQALKMGMFEAAMAAAGVEKSTAQQIREAVKETRKTERTKAKTEAKKAIDSARLAERMHEGALRAKDRRISENRERALKQHAAEREEKLKQGFRETTQKANETRLKRDMRTIALKWNQRLVKLLANPTEASHVPIQLAREVAELTKTITEYLDSGTERGRINLEKVIKAYQKAFDDQATIAEAQKENPKYDPRGTVIDREMYDEYLVQMMNRMNEIVTAKSFKELSAYEMKSLLDIVRGVAHTVYDANRMIGTSERRAIWEVGDTMIHQLEDAPDVKLKGYLETSLDLRRLARIFSGSNDNAEFVKLVNQLNDGAIEKERIAQVLQGIFAPVTEKYGEEIRKWYGKKAEWIDTGITQNGKKVEITKGMRVSLAMHVLNAGNMNHIANGGITIPNREMYNKGRMTDAYANGETVQLSAEQIEEIISHMTEAEKAYVEVAKEFFHKRTGYYVNKTSLQLLGYRKATVENYFPIHTDKNFTKTDFASLQMDGSIEGQDFLKERVNASNPVYLEDITSVVNRQIRGVALYAGLAVPMRNFNAVMNSTEYFEDENGAWRPRTTVRKSMTQKMGEYGTKVVKGFLEDASEMTHVDVTPMERFAWKLATNYVKAVLLGNLKVAMKQVASYPTAAAVIPWKYLGKALLKGGRNHRLISRADVDLINQYTPLYQIRREGNANEIASIMQRRGLEQKLPWLLGWITKMDVMTVGRLWSAAEYMVADQQNLPVGSDEYYKAVAKVFNDTIQQTQPNFTPLQRNAALRSKNPVVRSLVLFGTQRMQNGGILIEAAMDLKHSKGKSKAEIKAAKMKLGRAVASQIVQNILLIVASIGVDALRGRMKGWQDDDKEITAESLAKGMGDMFLSNFIGSFLGGSETYSLISGLFKQAMGETAYDTEFTVPALDAVETLINFAQSDVPSAVKYLLGDHTDEEKQKKAINFSYQLAKAFGYATGIPLENAVKDLFKGIIPAYQDHADWLKTGEFPQWWLHQSGKLDSAKTAANYKEWTNLGKSGREFFYIDNKLKGVTSREGRIGVLAGEDIPAEDKALLFTMYDAYGATREGSQVFDKKGKLLADFANIEPPSPIETTLNEIAEASAAPTAEPTATPNPLSEAKQEGVKQAVVQGVPEQTANDAFLTYQNMGKNHGDDYSRNDDFRAWLFTKVSDPHQRAVLEYQVIGQASKVEGSVTYRESGVVYRDYTNEAWFKLSEHNLAKDGTNKRYDAAKELEKTGLSADKTVAIYDGLKDLTKKAEWITYLKDQGLSQDQINIFLWSRGWYKRK